MNAVVEVAVAELAGTAILHAKGCNHIARDKNRLTQEYGFGITVTEYASLEDYSDEVWYDIATDTDEPAVRVMFRNTEVSPCAK